MASIVNYTTETLQQTVTALETAISVVGETEAKLLSALRDEVIEAFTKQSAAEHQAAGSAFTAIELPNQEDGFNWAISEHGKGLVLGIDGRPNRYMSKGSAQNDIERISPTPLPKTLGFAQAEDLISFTLSNKVRQIALRQAAEGDYNVPVFVSYDDWKQVQSTL